MALRTLGQPNGTKTLRLFDIFEIDHNLPKNRKPPKSEQQGYAKRMRSPDEEPSEGDDVEMSEPSSWNPSWGNSNSGISTVAGITVMGTATGNIISAGNGFYSVTSNGEFVPVAGPKAPPKWWVPKFLRKPEPLPHNPPPPPPPTTVQFVFDQILTNNEELALFNDRNQEFQALIESAKKLGQTSLLKKLMAEAEVRKYENALYAKGWKRFLSEAQLLKFVEKVEKGLCLDWISHYTRPIPASVAEKKVLCDEARLFDNYVILHYDPEDKATTPEDRAEEVRKRKDPILFGVMRGSRRLYFVDDWKDELCDLTLQEIVEKLGETLEMPEHVTV